MRPGFIGRGWLSRTRVAPVEPRGFRRPVDRSIAGSVRVVLHGRAAESARLRDLVADAVAARGGAIVVRGEPGAGKTALLTDTAEQAADLLVLWTQGIESESPLAFAALNRLLRPVLPHLDQIPAAQARALRVALGQPSPDPCQRRVDLGCIR